MATIEKKIPIKEAGKAELRGFALELGIPPLPTSWSREQVLNRIQQVYDKDYIVLQEDDVAGAGRQTVAQINAVAAAEGDTFVWVEINVSELDQGDEPVYVSCNGRGMLIPRGERVKIPRRMYESLKNAVMDVFDPLKDGGIATKPRKVPRFPHAVFKGPVEPEDMAA